METGGEAEQMSVVAPADVPKDPSFPVRLYFAAAGVGAALGLGVLLAVFLEFSDRSIRTEKDVAMAMDLPMLISVPWVVDEDVVDHGNGNGRRRFWGRPSDGREKVGV
jgi:capsular polysaccharide biosynthesis protein